MLKNWNHSQTGEYIAVKRGGGMVFCRESQALMNIFFVLDEIFFSLWPQKCRFSVHCSFLERVLKKQWHKLKNDKERRNQRANHTWNCCFFVYKTNCSCFQLFVYIWWSSFSFFFVAWKLEKKKGRAFILHMGRGVANAFVDLFGGRRSISSLCVVRGGIGGPEGQVVTQKLHDQRWVLVTILVQGVQLGNCLIKGL